MDRYHRQSLLPQIGVSGQARLAASRVAIVGCGALGTISAELLARAGVGSLRLIDRDLVELTNLQRQTLYDEADVAEAMPKAAAAARRLRAINSSIEIEPVVADLHAGNIEALVRDADVIIDGTDNAETRYLINDVAIKLNRPWVYGAAVGIEGRAMLVMPGQSACLRCLFANPPGPGELPTCDTAGVLSTVTAMVGVIQANLTLRRLIEPGFVAQSLTTVDVWSMRFKSVDLTEAKRADCPACGQRRFEFLDSPAANWLVTLCGQNAVQLRPANGERVFDLMAIGDRLRVAGKVQLSPFLVRCDLTESPGVRLTVFADARAIIHGTSDFARARSVYAKWIGN